MNVSVVGLGKLGATLAAVLADAGHRVYGVDVNEASVAKINEGRSPVDETGLDELIGRVSPRLSGHTAFEEAIPNSNITMIVVPTPSGDDDRFSNEYVLNAIRSVGANLPDGWHTVVVCSTVMPGASDEIIIPELERVSGRVVGETVGYCYNPEFIALGSIIHDMTHPDMILIGAKDETSSRDLRTLSESYVRNTPQIWVRNIVDAELAKIAVNTYVTMKISYANTVAQLAQMLPGADASAVLEAVGADSRIGHKYLGPGASFGGPCFPRDNKAFAALCEGLEMEASLARATDAVNEKLAEDVADVFNTVKRLAILGLSYKPHTPISEGSMGMRVAEILGQWGTEVFVHDPQARPDLPENVKQFETVEETLDGVDAVLVTCPWPEYGAVDFGELGVLDMWGCTKPSPGRVLFGQNL